MVLCIVLLNPTRENAGVREGIVRYARTFSKLLLNRLISLMPVKHRGAFHYAKLTGKRSVEMPEENGKAFSD